MGLPKYINKNILVLSAVSFFNDCSSELLYPIMPLFLLQFGTTPIWIGFIEGIAEFFSSLLKWHSGKLGDVFQKKLPLIILGYTLSVVARVILFFSNSFPPVLGGRLVDRLGKGIRTPNRDALLSAQTTNEHKGAVFGFHRSADTLGAIVGPVLALYLLSLHFNLKHIIGVAIWPGIIGVLILFFIKEQPVKHLNNKNLSAWQFWQSSNTPFKHTAYILGLLSLFNASDAFLILRCNSLGYSHAQCIGFYLLFNIVGALAHYPIGLLADKFNKFKMLQIGLVILFVSYALMAWAPNTLVVIISFLMYGLFYACTDGVAKALITNVVSVEDTGKALGFTNALQGGLFLISGLVAGALFSINNGALAMWYTAIGALVVFFASKILLANKNTYN